jgi:hypothetical protein
MAAINPNTTRKQAVAMPAIAPAPREEPDGVLVDGVLVEFTEVELVDGIATMDWLAPGSNWTWER